MKTQFSAYRLESIDPSTGQFTTTLERHDDAQGEPGREGRAAQLARALISTIRDRAEGSSVHTAELEAELEAELDAPESLQQLTELFVHALALDISFGRIVAAIIEGEP